MAGHALTHRSFTDGRLVPACICGWWSHDGSHAAFERHVFNEQQLEQEGASGPPDEDDHERVSGLHPDARRRQ